MEFSYREIEMAFDFVSSGEEGDNLAYLCRDAGEIFYYSETLGLDELRGRDIHRGDCLSIPHRDALDLGEELAFDFVDDRMPEEYAGVRDIFADPELGASRFRDMVEAQGRLEEWCEYEADRIGSVLREWCSSRGIALRE